MILFCISTMSTHEPPTPALEGGGVAYVRPTGGPRRARTSSKKACVYLYLQSLRSLTVGKEQDVHFGEQRPRLGHAQEVAVVAAVDAVGHHINQVSPLYF